MSRLPSPTDFVTLDDSRSPSERDGMKSSVTEVTRRRHHQRAAAAAAARSSRAASHRQRSREIYPLLFSAALDVVAPRSGLFEPPSPPFFVFFDRSRTHVCFAPCVFHPSPALSSFYLPSSSSLPAAGCDSCVFVSPDPPNARKYLQSEMKARQSGSDLSGLPTGCRRRECDGVCGSLSGFCNYSLPMCADNDRNLDPGVFSFILERFSIQIRTTFIFKV